MVTNHTKMNKVINDKFAKCMSSKAKKICMYPECRNSAVNSHTISRSILLNIANSGVVISPQVKRNDDSPVKRIVFEKIGINKASTFKGFCEEHEALFRSVDTQGINTFRDLFLQLYRSLCKCIFVGDSIRSSEKTIFSDGLIWCDKWENGKNPNATVLAEFFHDLLIDFPEAERELGVPDGYSGEFTPWTNTIKLGVKLIYKKVSFVIPVALQKKFTLKKGGIIYDVVVIVIPGKNSTSIVVATPPEDVSEWKNFFGSTIDVLCLVESLLMADSEWFLSPDVFDNWSAEKKNFLEMDYRYCNERKFLELYDVSIFDDIRKSLLTSLPEERRNIEIKKLTEIPERSPEEKREAALRENLISETISRQTE